MSRYDRVIHEPTGEYVSAFQFENIANWIGKDKDILLATPTYTYELNPRVEMIRVKPYFRKNGKKIHTHFKRKTNQPKLKPNFSGESDEHKKCKWNIYDGLLNGNITINKEKLREEDIEDIYMEYRTHGGSYIITDVLVKFKERHPKYGLGIFVEIQLSGQTIQLTNIRTYQRVIEGFSGVWLYGSDFDSNCEPNKNNLEVESHFDLLKELNDKEENEFISKINKYGEVIDDKLKQFYNQSNDILKYRLEEVEKKVSLRENEYLKKMKDMSEYISGLTKEGVVNINNKTIILEELKKYMDGNDCDNLLIKAEETRREMGNKIITRINKFKEDILTDVDNNIKNIRIEVDKKISSYFKNKSKNEKKEIKEHNGRSWE